MYLGTGKVLALVGTPADVVDTLRQLYGQEAWVPSCHEVPCRSDEMHAWFHDEHRTVATDKGMPGELPPPSTLCRGTRVTGDAMLETPPNASPGAPWSAPRVAC